MFAHSDQHMGKTTRLKKYTKITDFYPPEPNNRSEEKQTVQQRTVGEDDYKKQK